jgi:hypothetical protein
MAKELCDREVLAAIRKSHYRAPYEKRSEWDPKAPRLQWGAAWIDPGGVVFGLGPYAKVPVVEWNEEKGQWVPYGSRGEGATGGVVVRVYPKPERLRQRLHDQWDRGKGWYK